MGIVEAEVLEFEERAWILSWGHQENAEMANTLGWKS